MLMGRLSAHFRARDWTGVVADLVIVVVGVFIGLQAQQWAEARGQRALEASYLQRLHDELLDLEATRAPLLEAREAWAAALRSATRALFEAPRPLTEEECRAIGFSYATTNPTDDLASLLELQTSVRLSTITSTEVSRALQSFLLTRTRARDANAGIMAASLPLASAHPELIRVTVPTRVEGGLAPGTYACDSQRMRGDAGFLNDYEFAQSNFALHVTLNRQVSTSLADLHRALDGTLGIRHAPLADAADES